MTNKKQSVNASKPKILKTITNDGNTNVNLVWKGPKNVHSFRCSDKLWKAFVQETKQQGDSVCHVMEAIIAAVLGVLRENVYNRNTITIENLHVQRRVQRHRRVTHEFEPQANKFEPRVGWIFDSDAVLGTNGHAVGCACKICGEK